MTNPVLEHNLGRWAQVYFSTPPAKRQQAVGKLLEEIQRETAAVPAEKTIRPYFARDEKFHSALCSACQHQNPPGHRFCSRCGQTLHPANPAAAESMAATKIGEAAPPRPDDPSRSENPSPSQNDVQWLRDRAFSGLAESGAPQRRAWKYLVGAVVVVLAGFAYLQWAQRPKASRHQSAPQVSAPVASLPQDSSPAESNPPAAIPAEPKTPEARNSAAREPHDQAAASGGLLPASQKSPLLGAQSSRAAFAGDESGASDLRLAQRYLAGSMGVRDSSEAAKLLWKSVSKQNATAALLLSGLYLRGDGVPRSCDQARLLLLAAVRRGASQAAQQLRDLESQGCQ